MTQNDKLKVNSISYIISQIENECNTENKEHVKMINNIRIILEKNVVECENNMKYELEQKIEELRRNVHELSLLRKRTLNEFSEVYDKQVSHAFDQFLSKCKQKDSSEKSSNFITWETKENLGCENLLGQLSETFSTLKKCEQVLDEELIQLSSETDTGKSAGNSLSYFRNL